VKKSGRTARILEKLGRLFLLSPGVVWLLLFSIFPLVLIVGMGFASRGNYGQLELPFTTESYRRLAGFGSLGFDPVYPLILLRSFLVAAGTTVICMILALPMAFWIAKQRGPWKFFFLGMVVIPVWTNLLVRTYSWQLVLSPQGLLSRLAVQLGLLTEGTGIYPGWFAVSLGLVSDYLPVFILPVYAAVEKIDWKLSEAARDLGAHGWSVFRAAILPQINGGLKTGALFVFLPALSQFVIPDLLGGAKLFLLGNLLQQQFGPSRDWPFGSAMASVILLLMALMLGIGWIQSIRNKGTNNS